MCWRLNFNQFLLARHATSCFSSASANINEQGYLASNKSFCASCNLHWV